MLISTPEALQDSSFPFLVGRIRVLISTPEALQDSSFPFLVGRIRV